MEVPQARPLSPKSVRSNTGSKFSQTFSRFKGIIRLPGGRKPTGNEHGSSPPRSKDRKELDQAPYSTRGMALKAYMSHPVLGHQLHHPQTTRGDSDPDSSSSISPVEPSAHNGFSPPRPSFQQEDDVRSHSRAQSLDLTHDRAQDTRRSRQAPPPNHTSRRAGSPPTPATEGFKTRGRTGPVAHGSPERRTLKPLERRPSKSRIKPRPEDEHPVPLIPASFQTQSQSPPPELSMSTSTTSTITPATATQTLGSTIPMSSTHTISIEELRASLPTAGPHHSNRTGPSAKPSIASFVSSSGSSFVTAESHISNESAGAASVEKELPMLPPAIESRVTSEPSPSTSRDVEESPTTPMPKKGLPNLRIPMPARKFSLLSSGETARLSPSLVIRAPPLPILNLPKLTTPTSILPEDEGLQRRRSRAAGLNAMPALPRKGTGRGTGGHEEHDMEDDDVDDIEEEEDDIEEEDMDYHDNGLEPESRFGTTTSASDMSSDGRSSYDLGSHPSSGGSSGSSAFSYEGFGSLSRGEKPLLPPLNVMNSPFAVRFPGPPSTTTSQTPGGSLNSFLAKGKSRLVPTPSQDESEVAGGSRATATSSNLTGNDDNRGRKGSTNYFDSIHSVAPQRPSLLASSSSSRGHALRPSPQGTAGGSTSSSSHPRTPSIPPSPLHTPRPDDFRLSHLRSIPPPLPHAHSYSSNRDSLALGNMGAAVSVQSERPAMYKHASRSLIDLHAIEKRQRVERMVREGEEEQELKEMRRKSVRRNQRESGVFSNRDSVYSIRLDALSSREASSMSKKDVIEEDSGGMEGNQKDGQQEEAPRGEALGASSKRESLATEAWMKADEDVASQNRMSMAPAYDAGPHPLRKRRSMPVFHEASAPPPYPTFAPHPSARFANHTIQPRDDEGREVLPPYSNAIYLKAILPRKMEFTAPGLQAKDRKWRRVLCVLEGTMLKVFKCPSGPGGVSAIEQWWEKKVGAGDVAVQAAMPTGPGVRARPAAAPASDRNLEEEKAMHQYRSGEGPEVASVVLDQSSRSELPQPQMQRPGTSTSTRGKDYSQIALSKSALNVAVNLLKPPVGKHSRSHSRDEGAPPSPRGRGSSFDVSRSPTPAPSSVSSTTLASRSHSPMPSASSSSVPTPYGSDNSMASGSSPPSSSHLSPPPRPGASTFSSNTPPSSTRSRFRSATNSRTPSHKGGKDEVPEPGHDDLIRTYTLQNAESGLGNDYVKRKNVIRVRLEGEQFLLQAPDVASVVEWIEGLQAATNIALDLDARPMPRGPIFPRRRRRRRPVIPPISTSNIPNATSQQNVVTETYTPQSATAGQPALRRS